MAYTSDLRIKNYIKDVDRDIRAVLDKEELGKHLYLRVFDESNEDAKMWQDGGLAFADPITGNKLGSNDAGWFINNKIPLVIVEGTYATERGQFGDGQLNRFSHSLGVALNGYIGVTLVPYIGQSFVKKGYKKDILSKKINYNNGLLHKGMVTGALGISSSNTGKYLIIDPYDEALLGELVINATLNYYQKKNRLNDLIKGIILHMESYLGKTIYGAKSAQTIKTLYDNKKGIISENARFYTQNLSALTTSTKRDGHGLLGKNLISMYGSVNKIYSVFIRLTQEDIELLKKRNSKEFKFLLNNPRIVIKCFDDLIFTDNDLKQKVMDFKDKNLHQTTEKVLIKQIQQAFNSGEIVIKL